jgi:hypothetical protein
VFGVRRRRDDTEKKHFETGDYRRARDGGDDDRYDIVDAILLTYLCS